MGIYNQLCEMGLGLQLLLGALGLFFFVQLFYYCYYFAAPLRRLKKDMDSTNSKLPNVSVIVCAQNEAENLQEFVPLLLSQKYPAKFEVIVVNDGSTDESNEVLERMAQEHANLKLTFLPHAAKYMSRKKMCMSIAIKASNYDTFLFTDADCKPTSDEWLAAMASHMTEKKDVVLGASRFKQIEGLLGQLIDYDNLFSTMQFMGYAICGNPFRGDIRNLSYTKGLYYKAKGFSQHLDLETGEDDILLKDAKVSKEDVDVELRKEAITESNRHLSSSSYRLMKEQRLDNKKLYKGGIKFSLWLEKATRLLFYAATVAAIVWSAITMKWLALGIATFLFLMRYLYQSIIVYKNSQWLGCKYHPFGILFFDIYLPVYEFYLQTLGRIGRKRWEIWRV